MAQLSLGQTIYHLNNLFGFPVEHIIGNRFQVEIKWDIGDTATIGLSDFFSTHEIICTPPYNDKLSVIIRFSVDLDAMYKEVTAKHIAV